MDSQEQRKRMRGKGKVGRRKLEREGNRQIGKEKKGRGWGKRRKGKEKKRKEEENIRKGELLRRNTREQG